MVETHDGKSPFVAHAQELLKSNPDLQAEYTLISTIHTEPKALSELILGTIALYNGTKPPNELKFIVATAVMENTNVTQDDKRQIIEMIYPSQPNEDYSERGGER